MSFRDGLRQAMDRAGIDQTRLAQRLGVSRPAVGQWVSGVTEPTPRRLPGIANALGVSVAELLEPSMILIVNDYSMPQQESASSIKSGAGIPKPDPCPGDPIHDLDEAALLGMWRKLSIIKKATLFAHLGADDMPSLRKSA